MTARAILLAFLVGMLAASPARADAPLPLTSTVIVGPCPDSDALECTDRATATIWMSPYADRFALQHALGHLFDEQRLTPGDRNWFTRTLDLNGRAWRSGTGLNGGPGSPSERFADAYAACALNLSPDSDGAQSDWETAYDYFPTARHHRAVCRALWRVARR